MEDRPLTDKIRRSIGRSNTKRAVAEVAHNNQTFTAIAIGAQIRVS